MIYLFFLQHEKKPTPTIPCREKRALLLLLHCCPNGGGGFRKPTGPLEPRFFAAAQREVPSVNTGFPYVDPSRPADPENRSFLEVPGAKRPERVMWKGRTLQLKGGEGKLGEVGGRKPGEVACWIILIFFWGGGRMLRYLALRRASQYISAV